MNPSFAYIMVRNLEFNFLKIFNQSEDRNRSGRKMERNNGTMESWHAFYWQFMMVSTFCILIILEGLVTSFGDSYLKNY